MLGFGNGNGKEPRGPALPPASRSAMAETWLNEYDRLEQDNAFLREDNTRLANSLKVMNESYRLLKEELSHVRDQLDRVTAHDRDMLASMGNIKTLIIAAETNARAKAFAPPGSGVDATADRTAEAQARIDEAAAAMAGKLAPEVAVNA